MNELIQIKTNKQNKQVVSCKELYDGLGLNRSEWSRWYKRNIEKNEFFKENVDWVGFITTPNRGGKPTQDFAITIDFAKHIAMMARTEKSHEYRNYFLECERRLNNISTISQKEKLLLQLFSKDSMEVANAHKQLVAIEVQEATKPLLDKIEEDKPLVTFADRIMKNGDNILVRELAKIATDQGYKIGEKRLYDRLRKWGYIFKYSTEPTQYALEREYLIVETKIIKTPYGEKQTFTTRVTPKGQIKIVERLLKEK